MIDRLRLRALCGADAAQAIESIGHAAHFAKGSVLFLPGSACAAYAIVLQGRLDVILTGSTGREIALYQVLPGEVCLQTIQCLAADAAYTAEGRVVEDIDAVTITPLQFRSLMGESQAFRDYVLRMIASRFSSMSALVESIAAAPLPARLARALLARGPMNRIETTQSRLAIDIGSAREAVNRVLSRWEKDKIVRVGRGRIDILDRARLSKIGMEV